MPIRESRTLDFHIPRTQFTVRVVDEDSRRAIPEADISATNVFRHVSGEEMKLMQRAVK